MITSAELDALADQLHQELVVGCPICGGTGRIALLDGGEELPAVRSRRCRCLRAVATRLQLIDGNVPDEFLGSFVIERGTNRRNWEIVDKYAESLKKARKRGLGLLLTGENGVGKTFTACHILRAAARRRFSVFYVTMPEYIEMLKRGFADGATQEWLSRKANADFMVIDELGKEHKKPGDTFVASELDTLLRRRRGWILPTILVTNLDPDDLFSAPPVGYGESFTSLVHDTMRILQYVPGDFRKRNGAEEWDREMGLK